MLKSYEGMQVLKLNYATGVFRIVSISGIVMRRVSGSGPFLTPHKNRILRTRNCSRAAKFFDLSKPATKCLLMVIRAKIECDYAHTIYIALCDIDGN